MSKIRQATNVIFEDRVETVAARRMINQIIKPFGRTPGKPVGDTGYGSAEIHGWLGEERSVALHIPFWNKPKPIDGTF